MTGVTATNVVILLVDDRAENLLALEAILEPLGHKLVPDARVTKLDEIGPLIATLTTRAKTARRGTRRAAPKHDDGGGSLRSGS